MRIGTDKYAYSSKLKNVNPIPKIILSIVSVVFCLASNSVLASIFSICVFSLLIIKNSTINKKGFFHMIEAPFIFSIIGVLTIIIGRFPDDIVSYGIAVDGFTYGISQDGLKMAVYLIARVMGTVVSTYFLVLTTPMTDLLSAFRKMKVPDVILSLMELIYRFIFVLYDSAQQILIAQKARLGYQTKKQSLICFGELISSVFLKAYRKADKIYVSLESRGYNGALNVLSQKYESGTKFYFWCIAITIFQLILFIIEKRFI